MGVLLRPIPASGDTRREEVSMDFLQLFFGPIGRLLLGWEPSISFDPGTTIVRTKGGIESDPDG